MQMTLFDRHDNVVSVVENIESGGLTQDFELFYFDEPVSGSRVRLDVRGTTAGNWNAIAEVRRPETIQFLPTFGTR